MNVEEPKTAVVTILVVDDQPDILQVYSRALSLAGFSTQLADTAQSAIELIEATPPNAILLDLKMPYVNGVGFLYRLRERHPRMPVAVVTGLSVLDDTTAQEISSLGASVHFKPLSIVEVQRIARSLLGIHTDGA